MSDFIEINGMLVNKKCIEYITQFDTDIRIKFIGNDKYEDVTIGTYQEAKKMFESIKMKLNCGAIPPMLYNTTFNDLSSFK